MKILSILIALILFSAYSEVSAAEKIDINTAPLNDLIKIIHIGEKRGLELISLRPFSSLDDLARIKGIGPVRIKDIKKQRLAYVEPFLTGTTDLSDPIKPTTEGDEKPKISPLMTGAENFADPETNEPLKIDINTASAQDLQILAGIGGTLAQRIIDVRPFLSLDEIAKVNGIGVGTLENIKRQGLAWVDPNLAPSRAEKNEIFDEGLAVPSVSLRQEKNKSFLASPLPFLLAFALSIFSGIAILALKRKLKTFLN